MNYILNTAFNQRGSVVVLIETFLEGDGCCLLLQLKCLLMFLIERQVCLNGGWRSVTLLFLSGGINNLWSARITFPESSRSVIISQYFNSRQSISVETSN